MCTGVKPADYFGVHNISKSHQHQVPVLPTRLPKPPTPAEGLTKADNEECLYEDWTEGIAKNDPVPEEIYEAAENKQEVTANKQEEIYDDAALPRPPSNQHNELPQPPVSPPASEQEEDVDEEDIDYEEDAYMCADVKPVASSTYKVNITKPHTSAQTPAKGLRKADNEEFLYEDWTEGIAKAAAENKQEVTANKPSLPTPLPEDKQEATNGFTADKPSLPNQPYPDSNAEEEEEEEEEEEDDYQELDSVLKKLTADQQMEPPAENKQNGTASDGEESYEQEDYHPTTDDDDAHSKSDYPDNTDVNDKEKPEDSRESIPKDSKVMLSPISGVIGVQNGLNVTTKVSNKDDDAIERSHDL